MTSAGGIDPETGELYVNVEAEEGGPDREAMDPVRVIELPGSDVYARPLERRVTRAGKIAAVVAAGGVLVGSTIAMAKLSKHGLAAMLGVEVAGMLAGGLAAWGALYAFSEPGRAGRPVPKLAGFLEHSVNPVAGL